NDPLDPKIASNARNPFPIDPFGHPMTNPTMPLDVCDDQYPIHLWCFSGLRPTDRAYNRHRFCNFSALGNDFLALNNFSDVKILPPTNPTRHPMTNRIMTPNVADDQLSRVVRARCFDTHPPNR